jgi:hypothetical protein
MKSSRCPLVACSDVMGSSVTDILGAAEALAPAVIGAASLSRSAEELRWLMQHQRKFRLLSTGASSSPHHKVTASDDNRGAWCSLL